MLPFGAKKVCISLTNEDGKLRWESTQVQIIMSYFFDSLTCVMSASLNSTLGML